MRPLIIKKLYNNPLTTVWLVITINLILACGADITLPALPLMVKELNTSEFLAQLNVIIFLLGATIGRLLWGGLSERFGRKNILITNLSLQMMALMGCALAHDIITLIVWRAVQSLGAGVISVVGMTVLADLFSGKTRAMYLGILELSFPIGFIIGPLIGAYLVHLTHKWQSVFILLVILYALCILLVIILFKETHEKKIKGNLKAFFNMYITVLSDSKFMLYNTMASFIICAYLIFIISSPFIYMEQFNLTEIEYGYFQLTPMFFNMLSILLYKYYITIFSTEKALKLGLGALFILIPLYAIIAFDIVVVNEYLILSTICLQCIVSPFFIPALNSMALDLYPHRKGIAASIMASLKSLISGIGTIGAVYIFKSNFNDVFMVQIIIALVILLLWSILFKTADHV